jgi:hypothetical protein
MSDQFKIVFSGELKEDTDQNQFVESFCRYFKASSDQALALINAKREVVIKKGLSSEQGAKYLTALEKLGMVVSLEPMVPDGLSLVPMEGEESEKNHEPGAKKQEPTCPKCGSLRLAEGECLDCGIIIAKYVASGMATESAPYQSDNDPYRVTERTRSVEPEESTELAPRSVPAGNGWTWIADAFELFRSSTLGWLGATIVFILLLFLFSIIPLIGPLFLYMFSPVFAAGFMIGCHEQNEGGNFRVAHLFGGFQQNFGQLVLVGVIYLGAIILIGVVMVMVLASTLAAGGMDQLAAQDSAAVAAAMNPADILLPLLIAMALFLPVIMAYWFAPALVALEGVSATEALKLSFSACLKNILPFLVYGLAFFVLSILVSIVFGIVAVIHAFLAILALLLWMLALIPVVTASIYTGYRDIFAAE